MDKFIIKKNKQSENSIQSILQSVFKHKKFRNNLQEEAVNTVCNADKDVFISMPTGAGKSLCFQLPAVYLQKVAIVVSPLIALMQDQLQHLKNLDICAETINSKQLVDERKQVTNDLKSKHPKCRLLYITPEQAATSTFQQIVGDLMKNQAISLFIIDEAHCVSQWGHDFRPDYLKLNKLRTLLKGIPCIALTATAPEHVQKDIFQALGFGKNTVTFKKSVFRPNLFYDVKDKSALDQPYQDLEKFCRKALGQTFDKFDFTGGGIVYCHKREDCEVIAHELVKRGLYAKAYHAGLKTKERTANQEEWTEGKLPIIVATISFGMGVDKPDVRFVAHWTIPKSMAGYYQESGRAGRDGEPSFCRLYYSRSDCNTINFLINKSSMQKMNKKGATKNTNSVDKAAKENFKHIVEYCEGAKCRHKTICEFFGDTLKDCNKNCDFCKNPKAVILLKSKINSAGMGSFRQKKQQNAEEKQISPMGCFDSSLYAGGRKGYGIDRTVDDDGDDYHDSSADRENENKELDNLLGKQFALRRGSRPNRRNPGVRPVPKNSPLINPGSTRLSNCDAHLRQGRYEQLKKAITDNHEASSSIPLPSAAILLVDKASHHEHKIFSTAKTLAGYTSSLIKLIQELKRFTSQKKLHSLFKSEKENSDDSTTAEEYEQLASHTTKRRSFASMSTSHGGFQSALELTHAHAFSDDDDDDAVEQERCGQNTKKSTKSKKTKIQFNDEVSCKFVEKYIKPERCSSKVPTFQSASQLLKRKLEENTCQLPFKSVKAEEKVKETDMKIDDSLQSSKTNKCDDDEKMGSTSNSKDSVLGAHNFFDLTTTTFDSEMDHSDHTSKCVSFGEKDDVIIIDDDDKEQNTDKTITVETKAKTSDALIDCEVKPPKSKFTFKRTVTSSSCFANSALNEKATATDVKENSLHGNLTSMEETKAVSNFKSSKIIDTSKFEKPQAECSNRSLKGTLPLKPGLKQEAKPVSQLKSSRVIDAHTFKKPQPRAEQSSKNLQEKQKQHVKPVSQLKPSRVIDAHTFKIPQSRAGHSSKTLQEKPRLKLKQEAEMSDKSSSRKPNTISQKKPVNNGKSSSSSDESAKVAALKLKNNAKLIVACLTPMYTKALFASKDIFKEFSKNLNLSFSNSIGNLKDGEIKDIVVKVFNTYLKQSGSGKIKDVDARKLNTFVSSTCSQSEKS